MINFPRLITLGEAVVEMRHDNSEVSVGEVSFVLNQLSVQKRHLVAKLFKVRAQLVGYSQRIDKDSTPVENLFSKAVQTFEPDADKVEKITSIQLLQNIVLKYPQAVYSRFRVKLLE